MIPSTSNMIRQQVNLSQMILLSSVFNDCLILNKSNTYLLNLVYISLFSSYNLSKASICAFKASIILSPVEIPSSKSRCISSNTSLTF